MHHQNLSYRKGEADRRLGTIQLCRFGWTSISSGTSNTGVISSQRVQAALIKIGLTAAEKEREDASKNSG
jgi:hypothetical protein